MESILKTENAAYFNIRKKYGSEAARRVIDYWYSGHLRIDPPSNHDEALFYYIFGEEIRQGGEAQ